MATWKAARDLPKRFAAWTPSSTWPASPKLAPRRTTIAAMPSPRPTCCAPQARSRRFVHVSSLAAAGPSTADRPLTETDEPHPVSHYGRSKLAGEQAVRQSPLAAQNRDRPATGRLWAARSGRPANAPHRLPRLDGADRHGAAPLQPHLCGRLGGWPYRRGRCIAPAPAAGFSIWRLPRRSPGMNSEVWRRA